MIPSIEQHMQCVGRTYARETKFILFLERDNQKVERESAIENKNKRLFTIDKKNINAMRNYTDEMRDFANAMNDFQLRLSMDEPSQDQMRKSEDIFAEHLTRSLE